MGNKNWSSLDVVKSLSAFNKLCANDNVSERDAAETVGVPRTTLRHWNQHTGSTLIPECIQSALRTEEGLTYFHVIVNVIHFACTQLSKTGTRLVEFIIDMTGLSSMISGSYGSLHERSVLMENYINEFGSDETERLSKGMAHKNISLGKDETFNKNRPCLVAIEPVSNYIITETYTDKRTARNWGDAVEASLSGLNVTVIQNVNDSGSAIKTYNDAHHPNANDSQDLFHILNRSNQSIVGPLSSKQRSTEKNMESLSAEIEQKTAKIKRISLSDIKDKHKKDKVSKLQAKCQQLQMEKYSEEKQLQQIVEWKKRNNVANKFISTLYHPYHLESGSIRSVEGLQIGLEEQYDEIKSLAKEMSLSEKSVSRIDRAANCTTSMLTTLRFYFNKIDELIGLQDVSLPIERMLQDSLIPIEYLKMASAKEQLANDRHAIMNVAHQLEKKLSQDILWNTQTLEMQAHLKGFARECAEVFQRSSSCVEGRNGHLTLWHHGVGSVSPRKSSAKTVVDNYFVERANDTTAAERFFGEKPKKFIALFTRKNAAALKIEEVEFK